MKARLAAWGLALFATMLSAPAEARIDVLDVAAVPLERIDGRRPHELSGLAWDHERGVLYAVSDRGVLFAWQLRLADDRIDRLAPLWARPVAPAGRRINAEAIDLDRNGSPSRTTLIVGDELGTTAWSLDPASMTFTAFAWPAGLDDARRSKQGIEALAWSAHWGAIAAAQRPPAHATGRPHEIHAERASQPWRLARTSVPRSAIKAIEAAPSGHVIALEKVGGGTDVHRLRRFDPAACTPAGCDEHAAEIPALRNLPTAPNWEGLACRPDGVCLIVSDDADLVGHGWLMLLRLRFD